MIASLNILCCNPLRLKNKITKIEHKKTFCGPSKNLKNISWPINICLKYLLTPTKTLRPPSYILNVRSLIEYTWETAYFMYKLQIFNQQIQWKAIWQVLFKHFIKEREVAIWKRSFTQNPWKWSVKRLIRDGVARFTPASLRNLFHTSFFMYFAFIF